MKQDPQFPNATASAFKLKFGTEPECFWVCGEVSDREAMRAMIEKAVNNHTELVETCRALLSNLPYGNEALQIKAENLLRGLK